MPTQPASIPTYGDLGRLNHVIARAKAGFPITISAIGGSITAGAVATNVNNRWLNLVASWIGGYFGITVYIVNSGISGTASEYGALRAQRDIIAHNVDLVFPEYAVNDGAVDAPSYDSLLRELLLASPAIAVVPVMFCDCKQRSVESTLLPIAEYYGLPVVSYVDGVVAALADCSITLAQVTSPDGVHPPDFGHALASQYIIGLLQYSLCQVEALPPLHPNPFDKTTLISDAALGAAVTSGFIYAPNPGNVPTLSVGALMSSTVGDTFSIPINVGPNGLVWLQVAQSNNSTGGTILTQIDGVSYNVTDCNNPAQAPNNQVLVQVASGLTPGAHTLKVTNWPSPSHSGAFLWICAIGTA